MDHCYWLIVICSCFRSNSKYTVADCLLSPTHMQSSSGTKIIYSLTMFRTVLALSLLCSCVSVTVCTVPAASSKVFSVTFLLTVNDTWYPDDYPHKKCILTVKTPPLKPDQKWNESERIHVGECDQGPLIYSVTDEGRSTQMYIICALS